MNKYLSSILLVFIVGCASVSNQQRISALDESTRRYGSAIRWSYFEIADSFRSKELASEHETDFNSLKRFRVTSYEVINRKLSSDNMKALQTVEIKFYYQSDMIEKTLIDNQEWLYNVYDKKWYLSGNLPHFDQNQ